MTNPYIRAAQKVPAIKEEATVKLEQRLQEDAEIIDGILMKRARDEQGRFIADDPSTPENEAWREVQP